MIAFIAKDIRVCLPKILLNAWRFGLLQPQLFEALSARYHIIMGTNEVGAQLSYKQSKWGRVVAATLKSLPM